MERVILKSSIIGVNFFTIWKCLLVYWPIEISFLDLTLFAHHYGLGHAQLLGLQRYLISYLYLTGLALVFLQVLMMCDLISSTSDLQIVFTIGYCFITVLTSMTSGQVISNMRKSIHIAGSSSISSSRFQKPSVLPNILTKSKLMWPDWVWWIWVLAVLSLMIAAFAGLWVLFEEIWK